MSGSEIFLIHNPTAGGRAGRQIWPVMQTALKQAHLPVVEAVAEAPGDAWALAEKAAREGYEILAAAGGDGTIHEVVNGLLTGAPERPPALAIIPVGTANIMVRALGLPTEPPAIAAMLRRRVRRRIDVGQVNDRYYATIAGIGFDGEVVRRSRRWPPWFGGKLRHLLAGVEILPGYRAVGARVRVNGREERMPLFLLAAANTGWYGGGIHIAPHARVDDGLLSVIIVRSLTPGEALTALRWTLSGRHLQHPKVGHTMATEIRVEADEPLAIHADGEDLGHGTATFRCLPGRLEVIVPGGE